MGKALYDIERYTYISGRYVAFMDKILNSEK